MGIAKQVAVSWVKEKLRRGKHKVAPGASGPSRAVAALKKENELSPVLRKEAEDALRAMVAKDPSLKDALRKAYAYAVFPSVGKASLLIGGAFGLGEIFEYGRVTGYAALIQLTVGMQVGGTTFHELIVFDTKQDLQRFKQGKLRFAANASAVLTSAGAAASHAQKGTRVFVHSEGGMLLEAAIGGQKFIVKPAVLGRLKIPDPKATVKQAAKFGVPQPPMR